MKVELSEGNIVSFELHGVWVMLEEPISTLEGFGVLENLLCSIEKQNGHKPQIKKELEKTQVSFPKIIRSPKPTPTIKETHLSEVEETPKEKKEKHHPTNEDTLKALSYLEENNKKISIGNITDFLKIQYGSYTNKLIRDVLEGQGYEFINGRSGWGKTQQPTIHTKTEDIKIGSTPTVFVDVLIHNGFVECLKKGRDTLYESCKMCPYYVEHEIDSKANGVLQCGYKAGAL